MLLQFSVENYRSFKELQAFDMIATRERNGRENLPRFESRYRMSVNPVAALYGANASGKSNMVRALAQLKSVITHPRSAREPLLFDPFKLDETSGKSQTYMSVSFMASDFMFTYELKWDRKQIHFEQLIRFGSKSETIIFRRSLDEPEIQVDERYEGTALQTLIRGVVPNITVLSAVSNWNNPDDALGRSIRQAYNWFENLIVVPADAWDDSLVGALGSIAAALGLDENIKRIDAGVEGFHIADIEPSEIGLSESRMEGLLMRLEDGAGSSFSHRGALYTVTMRGEEVSAKKLSVQHRSGDKVVPMQWADESDGTKQAIRILPILMALTNPENPLVVVIDELDRSLHTHLAQQMIASVIEASNPETRGQLIFTTHDVMLLDTDLLRRDQIWIVDKSYNGASNLIALTDYRGLRKDKDIRKSYLEGRFGGVPRTNPFNLHNSGLGVKQNVSQT